jgi:DnaJ like chaperone protein
MTGHDVLVILGCLVLGYVGVSFLMAGRKPGPGPTPAPASSSEAGRATGPGEAPREPPRESEPPHWSAVLEVARDASVDEIRAAYRRLISLYHPDKVATLGQALRDLAEEKSREITHAYQAGIRERAGA